MALSQPTLVQPRDLLPGEHIDIRRDVADIIQEADQWLDTPNDRFGGRKPGDLIGTADEELLRNAVRSIKYGLL